MGGYHINQGVWFVARENRIAKRVEYLDNDRDVFYFEGVFGYATKVEAHERAARYVGDKHGMFVMGPKYGRYVLGDSRCYKKTPKNVQLNRFEIMDRLAEKEKSVEQADELRTILKDFAITHGVWCFSNLEKTKRFLTLCHKYDALSDTDIKRLLYDTK